MCVKLSEIVSEVQVRKFGKFLEEYASQLKDVEDALEESNGDSWDLMLDPVSIEVSDVKKVSYLQPLSLLFWSNLGG